MEIRIHGEGRRVETSPLILRRASGQTFALSFGPTNHKSRCATSRARLLHARTDRDERCQSIQRLTCGPHHAAENQDAVKRIVERRGEMPGNAHENAAAAPFER